jgi:Fe-S-cluster containining protein
MSLNSSHIPLLMADLTPAAASDICMTHCRAMCCRGPLILRLSQDEVHDFEGHAVRLGVAVQITQTPEEGGWLRFLDHPGEHCPMLDDATSACLIYEYRPKHCREFPRRPTPGCLISGWTEEGTN